MREKNRNSIESNSKLPQFTTMNVIDGQAGVIIYSSLICYSLTIDNILNIIVLLILAGVTIATLTGDNGLLQKTTNAKENSKDAEICEQLKLVYAEYQIGQYSTAVIVKERLQGIFGEKNVSGVELNNGKLKATIYDKQYQYDSLTGIAGILKEWKQDEDGSYSNESTKGVKVGDVVKYETILNNSNVDSAKLNTLKDDLINYSGAGEAQENTSINRDNLLWQVLDVKDGKMRIISTTQTTQKIKLNYQDGYNNAVYLIDEVCDTLYSSNKGKSQNLKIEDIEEKIDKSQFDYTQATNSIGCKLGEPKEYNANLNYPNIYTNEIGCKALAPEDNTGNTLGLSEQLSLISGKNTATNKIKVTQTYWNRGRAMEQSDFVDSRYWGMFVYEKPTCWLSSRCIDCSGDYVTYGVYVINNIREIKYSVMYYSTGWGNNDSRSLRPVVTLDSDVQLEPDGTNTWKIK